MKILRVCFMVAALMGLTACAGEPYVLDSNEFNRGAADFGQDPTDIFSVQVCYSASNTTPDAVRALAVDACGAFGKTARYVDQDYMSCPLTTPVSANYDCDGPGEGPEVGKTLYPFDYFYNQN